MVTRGRMFPSFSGIEEGTLGDSFVWSLFPLQVNGTSTPSDSEPDTKSTPLPLFYKLHFHQAQTLLPYCWFPNKSLICLQNYFHPLWLIFLALFLSYSLPPTPPQSNPHTRGSLSEMQILTRHSPAYPSKRFPVLLDMAQHLCVCRGVFLNLVPASSGLNSCH